MSNLPIVTIYITNFNYSRYITTAIESALSQTYENIEILIIDDGSEDQTYKMLEEISKTDNRIKLF